MHTMTFLMPSVQDITPLPSDSAIGHPRHSTAKCKPLEMMLVWTSSPSSGGVARVTPEGIKTALAASAHAAPRPRVRTSME
jgi:hypothetical protein